jgi:hypothetical protein
MIHQCQGLPLGLETGDHLAAIHACLDHFQGDHALDRLTLLGHPDRAHAAFAELLQQLVAAADDDARLFGSGTGRRSGRCLLEVRQARCGSGGLAGRPVQEVARLGMRLQQCLDSFPQGIIPRTRRIQVGTALFGEFDLQGTQEDLVRSWIPRGHDVISFLVSSE